MSEINGQTDDVALLVNWFFCSPFPPYENLKVDKALGVEVVTNSSGSVVMNVIQLQVLNVYNVNVSYKA